MRIHVSVSVQGQAYLDTRRFQHFQGDFFSFEYINVSRQIRRKHTSFLIFPEAQLMTLLMRFTTGDSWKSRSDRDLIMLVLQEILNMHMPTIHKILNSCQLRIKYIGILQNIQWL